MNYKKGYKGDDLKQYQEKLGVANDGDFGPKTDKAVRDFQTKNNLTVDGIIGPKTRNAFANLNPAKSNISDITPGTTGAKVVGTRTKDIASLGNKLSNPDAVNYNAKDYIAELDKRGQVLQDRKDKEFDRINDSFDAQKTSLEKSQEGESGTLRNKLVRMGGYLGDSGSHVAAQIGLDQEHRAEISALDTKRESALQKAREAYENKDFALAEKEYEVARQAEKDTETSKSNYFNRQIKLQQEQRNAEKEDIQIDELKKSTVYGPQRNGAVLDLIGNGVKNPIKLLNLLNTKDNGEIGGNYTLKDVTNTLASYYASARNPNLKTVTDRAGNIWELTTNDSGHVIGKFRILAAPKKDGDGDGDGDGTKNNYTIVDGKRVALKNSDTKEADTLLSQEAVDYFGDDAEQVAFNVDEDAIAFGRSKKSNVSSLKDAIKDKLENIALVKDKRKYIDRLKNIFDKDKFKNKPTDDWTTGLDDWDEK